MDNEYGHANGKGSNGYGYTHGPGPRTAGVGDKIEALKIEPEDPDQVARATSTHGAIAFVHFDPGSASSNMVEALVHHDDLTKIHRGMYVHVVSTKDGRRYSGRVVEGPFYGPDALRRDSTPVTFIVLNQGQGRTLALPEYHGWMAVELLGEERNGGLYGATRRPHPASPIFPYDAALMRDMFHLGGNIRLGVMDSYDDVFVDLNGDDKGVLPRNLLTVGTIGSGKSNTNQVLIEETLAAGYAQIVVDPEGEYVFMDRPSEAPGIADDLAVYERVPQGVHRLTVYKPPNSQSKRADAIEFSVPFEALAPELVVELAEMTQAQEFRFSFLYDQAIRLLNRRNGNWDGNAAMDAAAEDDLDLTRGYPGITLDLLLDMLNQELEYHASKSTEKKQAAATGKRKRAASGKKDSQAAFAGEEDESDDNEDGGDAPQAIQIYCHEYRLPPLIRDPQDVMSYGALRKKLREMKMWRIFDRPDAPQLPIKRMCQPGQLTVIDMSDAPGQQITNVVIADLLARVYHYKMGLTEEQNTQRKVIITLEEAHGFVSRERQDKMQQTLDQLRRIARRGRKRWLCLHFVTQSPQHLPSELFELANNKLIHQVTGMENLRVIKAAAGSINEAIWADVPSLGRGRAVIVSSQFPSPLLVQVRPAASKRNYTV